MDATAIRSFIAGTLDADADVRQSAELQLKQVRVCGLACDLVAMCLWCWLCAGGRGCVLELLGPDTSRDIPQLRATIYSTPAAS